MSVKTVATLPRIGDQAIVTETQTISLRRCTARFLSFLQMWHRQKQSWIVILIANVLINVAIATPIYVPQFVPGGESTNAFCFQLTSTIDDEYL